MLGYAQLSPSIMLNLHPRIHPLTCSAPISDQRTFGTVAKPSRFADGTTSSSARSKSALVTCRSSMSTRSFAFIQLRTTKKQKNENLILKVCARVCSLRLSISARVFFVLLTPLFNVSAFSSCSIFTSSSSVAQLVTISQTLKCSV